MKQLANLLFPRWVTGLGFWPALATAAVSAATSMYGANKQAKATAAANDANLRAQEEAQRQNWLAYLMQRGITPSASTQTGQVPGYAEGSAMNTKLPLWMNVATPTLLRNTTLSSGTPAAAPASAKPFLRRKA